MQTASIDEGQDGNFLAVGPPISRNGWSLWQAGDGLKAPSTAQLSPAWSKAGGFLLFCGCRKHKRPDAVGQATVCATRGLGKLLGVLCMTERPEPPGALRPHYGGGFGRIVGISVPTLKNRPRS